MNKLWYSIKALWLMIFDTKIFRPERKFKNKRVAIIGPAGSAFDKENGEYIDNFDFVIRINKAPHSWTEEKAKCIGTKTDILFHSFFENNTSGGGPLDIDLYKKFRIGYLINPRVNFEAYRRTFNFFRKYQKSYKVYHLPGDYYQEMCKPFMDKRPTMGYAALFSGLNSNCSELFITGLTFFKTPYSTGYRDHFKDVNVNAKHLKDHGIHDADLEYRLFKKLLERSKCQKIILDDQLEKILASDHEKVS